MRRRDLCFCAASGVEHMDIPFLDVGGVAAAAQSITIPRARLLADAVAAGTLDYVRLVECRRRDGDAVSSEAEIIIVDLDIQRPQLVENDIRAERVAVVLEPADDAYPEVCAAWRFSVRAAFELAGR